MDVSVVVDCSLMPFVFSVYHHVFQFSLVTISGKLMLRVDTMLTHLKTDLERHALHRDEASRLSYTHTSPQPWSTPAQYLSLNQEVNSVPPLKGGGVYFKLKHNHTNT